MKMGGYKISDKKNVPWRDNLSPPGTILPRTFISSLNVEKKRRGAGWDTPNRMPAEEPCSLRCWLKGIERLDLRAVEILPCDLQ